MQAMYRRGEEDAMKAGVILGARKGKADMLIELLKDEFGEVNNAARYLIYELDEAELRDCFKRLKLAQSVDEVVGHLF
ncbi:MAG: hypothetical protein DRR16_18855 [Candidatus Parabeggiatoa sp. nov. 3]|nr:MAG: hypothetical protein DRR00_22990 [Gammaproteobacteria bacterium]RKZ63510.1 MAG: hypothetical protein DRQ99_17010 [Gammaproteobacteria bacterium]RKZ82801.1 MAG: hypothetical protein DRR16_18855 [Gammaproteobacteria bacterium]